MSERPSPYDAGLGPLSVMTTTGVRDEKFISKTGGDAEEIKRLRRELAELRHRYELLLFSDDAYRVLKHLRDIFHKEDKP